MPIAKADFEFLLRGLEQELADGMARLKRAGVDGAIDLHVNLYRRTFAEEVRLLRRAIAFTGPDGYEVAYHALLAAFHARTWPWLKENRRDDTARDQTNKLNETRQATATTRRQRCIGIAGAMKTKPTAERVRLSYAATFSREPTPSLRAISRYLKTSKK